MLLTELHSSDSGCNVSLMFTLSTIKHQQKLESNSLFCCWLFVHCYHFVPNRFIYLIGGILLTRSQGYCHLWPDCCDWYTVIKTCWPPWWLGVKNDSTEGCKRRNKAGELQQLRCHYFIIRGTVNEWGVCALGGGGGSQWAGFPVNWSWSSLSYEQRTLRASQSVSAAAACRTSEPLSDQIPDGLLNWSSTENPPDASLTQGESTSDSCSAFSRSNHWAETTECKRAQMVKTDAESQDQSPGSRSQTDTTFIQPERLSLTRLLFTSARKNTL